MISFSRCRVIWRTRMGEYRKPTVATRGTPGRDKRRQCDIRPGFVLINSAATEAFRQVRGGHFSDRGPVRPGQPHQQNDNNKRNQLTHHGIYQMIYNFNLCFIILPSCCVSPFACLVHHCSHLRPFTPKLASVSIQSQPR